MARTPIDSGSKDTADNHQSLTFQANGEEKIELPSSEFISDAKMTRDGNDLLLETPNGETAVIEGYFSADPAPVLHSPDGGALTPNLVNAFSRSPLEFAANETASDQSPVGAVEEVKGNATVTRADGTVETVTIGTPIYQGDIIETDASGAVNITFIDETSMAVAENARLAIDEYSYDPTTESGTTNFSVLRGLFVFTSGLIGRDDPDDVTINTPVGSIGIRGTIIAGDINPGGESSITVLEGAIVVKSGLSETTLSEQFETVRLNGFDQPMNNVGVVPASEISHRFEGVGNVSPSLFTTINDAVKEQSSHPVQQPSTMPDAAPEQPAQQKNGDSSPQTNTPTSPAMPQDIISLNGNNGGLPSMDVALGQTPTSVAGNATGTTNIFNPALPPAPTTAAHPTMPAPTADIPVTPPHTLPAAPQNPAPFTLTATTASISDIAVAGALIATITPSNASAGTTYKFSSSSSMISDDGYYQLVNTATGAELRLTTAGATYFAGSLDARPLSAYDIKATTSDGNTASISGSIQVVDASGTNVINLDNPSAHNVSVITDSNAHGIGYSITALGDVNQDGFDDFAFTNNINGQNYVYIAHGGASNLQSGNWDLSGSNVIQKTNPTALMGGNSENTKISGIGDFDGDGRADYIIGQESNSILGQQSGNFAIVNGSGSQSIYLSSGGNASDRIGSSVSGIGDYNNDGHADVLIGAPGAGSTGKVYLIDGGKAWSSITLSAGSTEIASSGGDNFGAAVAGIGDINGDGYLDFAVGAPDAIGSVTIFHGGKSGFVQHSVIQGGAAGDAFGSEIFGLGDVNGDGFSDFIASGQTGKGSIYFGSSSGPPTTTTFNFQNYTLSDGGTAGDFNGDGYADFTISLSDGTNKSTYVVFGKDSMPNSMDLNYLKDGRNALEIKYSSAPHSEDLELKSIGDINGDGYDDLAIGVMDANGAAAGDGGIMVVYGRDTGTHHTTKTLIGNAGDNTLNDDGLTNVSMRGGAGDDIFQIHNTNFLGINGGSNNSAGDTIQAYGDLDFSAVNYEKISGIEKLEFAGTGQKITLTVENLFNLMKSSDTGTLTIDSIAGNQLFIDAGAANGTTGAAVENALNEMGSGADYNGVNGNGYHEFSIGGYTLYIDAGVALNVQ